MKKQNKTPVGFDLNNVDYLKLLVELAKSDDIIAQSRTVTETAFGSDTRIEVNLTFIKFGSNFENIEKS